MGVADIVDADPRNPSLFAAGAQVVFEKIDGTGNDPVVLFQSCGRNVIHDLRKEKIRHGDVSHTVFRLWRRDEVLMSMADIGFCDL